MPMDITLGSIERWRHRCSTDASASGSTPGTRFSLVEPQQDVKVDFGKCSVFDVFVESKDALPFEVPVGSYLEEVLIGLNAAPEPPGSPGGSPISKKEKKMVEEPHSPQMRSHYHRLRRLVDTKGLRDSCLALFWIAVGVITNRVRGDIVAEFRRSLAQAWCLVVLEVNQQVHRDQDAQDFLLRALPAILVQTIYRLLVDCFPEDKTQFVQHVDPLLEKLSHVVTYEVSGFQQNVETYLKERRQLFRKVVLDSPFVNQRDSVKAQMRKDLLEHRRKEAPPLRFGTSVEQGGQPLEETQLQHVMQTHDEKKNGIIQLETSSSTPVPQELDVDRYAAVAIQGSELFDRQFQELLPQIDAPPTLGEVTPKPPSCGAPALSNGSSPSGLKKSGNFNLSKMKAHARKSVSALHIFNTKKARESEAVEKRRRADQLINRIVHEPLPPELCERTLDTTWVSPITNRLAAPERDRQALRKRAAEAHQLKMAPLNKKALPSLVTKSHSAPELRELRGGSHELPKLGSVMRLNGSGGSLGTEGEATGATGLASSSESLTAAKLGTSTQKGVKSGASTFGEAAKVLHTAVAEDLIIGPPPSLQSHVVMQRLEEAGETFHANSFGHYVKEFDITSGQKKTRMDPAAMRKAETTYVTSMQALVGPPEQPALKMFDSPLQMARRRIKTKPVGSGSGLLSGDIERRQRADSGHSSWSEPS